MNLLDLYKINNMEGLIPEEIKRNFNQKVFVYHFSHHLFEYLNAHAISLCA